MKKRIRLILAVIFFMGALSLNGNVQTRTISANQPETNSDFVEKQKVEVPNGVEIFQTLTTGNEIFAVGTSKATEGDFAFGGTNEMRSIFVAKYSKDLKLEKVVDTTYKIAYFSETQEFCKNDSEVCDEKNPEKTFSHEDSAFRYLLEIKNGALFVVGQESENEATGGSCAYNCIFKINVRKLFVSKYKLDLTLMNSQKYGSEITEEAKKSDDPKSYVSIFNATKYIMTENGIYARYQLFVPRTGTEGGIVKIDLDKLEIQKSFVGMRVDKLNYNDEIYDFAQYKDGIAILTLNSWKFYDANLQFESEISQMDKVRYEEAMTEENIQGESFFTNSGNFISFNTHFSRQYQYEDEKICTDYICSSVEKDLTHERVGQSEQGQLFSISTQGDKVYLSAVSDKGKKQGGEVLLGNKKQEQQNYSIESYKDTIVVVAQNTFAIFNYASTATAYDGQMKNDCVKGANFSKNTIGYQDPKSGACYIAQKTITYAAESEVGYKGPVKMTTSKIYKDGKELTDVKTSSLGSESKNGPLNTLNISFIKMITDNNGHLYVIGDVNNHYVTGKARPYALSIDVENGQVLGVHDKGRENGETTQNTATEFENIVISNKNEVVVTGTSYDVTGQNGFPNMGDIKYPYAAVLNEKMELQQDLFKTTGAKYANQGIEQFESLNETYYKMSITSTKKEFTHRIVLFDKTSQKFVDEIKADTITSAKIDGNIIYIENGNIVEKDSSGSVVKKQKVNIENAQVAPKKVNDKYVVANRDKEQKLKFYLINDSGNSVSEITTEILVKDTEAIIFDTTNTVRDSVVRFHVVSKDGVAKKQSVNLEELKDVDGSKINQILIVGAVALIVIVGAVSVTIYLLIRKRKGKGGKTPPHAPVEVQYQQPQYEQTGYQQEYQQPQYEQYNEQNLDN